MKVDWRFPSFSTEEIEVASFEGENPDEENYADSEWDKTIEVSYGG